MFNPAVLIVQAVCAGTESSSDDTKHIFKVLFSIFCIISFLHPVFFILIVPIVLCVFMDTTSEESRDGMLFVIKRKFGDIKHGNWYYFFNR